MISFQNVSKIYPPDTVALDNISFKIKKGEFLSLAGRSGAGKSTLLRLLLAQEEPTKGRVFFQDKDIHKITKRDLPEARRKMGVVFQDYKLLASKTVTENVAFVLEAIGVSDEQIENDVGHVLEIVGLDGKADNFPKELSAGERQRAAIARALVHRPEVILADEPTGNLDPYNTSDVVGLLLKINQLGTTVILATHNKEVINRLKKRVVVLDKGKLVRDDEKGKFSL